MPNPITTPTDRFLMNEYEFSEALPVPLMMEKVYYRYEERIENCGYFDPDGDYFYRSETNKCMVILLDFPVKAETRCGVWISDRLGMRKWINSSWNKRYAHPTKEEAWTSFVARKKRQHRFLYARLAAIESLLEMPLPTDEEFASHLPHQTARTAYAPSAPPSKTPSALKGAGATPTETPHQCPVTSP